MFSRNVRIAVIVHSCFLFIDCGLLSHPTNGWVTLAEKTSEGQVAVYTCILGFTLSDVTLATRTCLSTGEWRLTAPQCIVGELQYYKNLTLVSETDRQICPDGHKLALRGSAE